MTTWIALLRGINVGGVRLPMADLRAAIASAGGTDIETYIQSGNAVFDHPARAESEVVSAVEREIAESMGRPIATMVRSVAQWRGVVDANPYDPTEPTHLHVTFFDHRLAKDAFATVDLEAFAPETFTVHGRELYLHLPNGIGRSKLASALTKGGRSAPVGTTRNWNTVMRLAGLADR